nr:RNA-directed DNA polymerase, eukaryota [Tanacetum cinerariifolium]
MGSILVNGSPTSEFKFYKGLKEGYPLSPFLFILIMESLHISFENVLNAGLFKGIQFNDSLCLSHLFYAYDVVFIGKWDTSNFAMIVKVLKFFLASGLKINIYKSKLMGIKIPHDVVVNTASSIGLSKWKLKTLSIGGRFTLMKSVLSSLPLLGNGEATPFWDDILAVDSPLKRLFPRLYLLESNKCCSVAAKLRDSSLVSSFRRPPRGGIEDDQLRLLEGTISPVLLSQSSDRWTWRLESSGDFSVKSARNYIDDSFLPKSEAPTRWIVSIPIKVNIFAWKVCLDKLPTRLNLSLRGLDIPSILCPICFVAGESSAHLLFSCNLARQLSSKVSRWWEVDSQDFHSYGEWLSWFKNLRFSKRLKDIFEGVMEVEVVNTSTKLHYKHLQNMRWMIEQA